jgi:hypothetical protein
MMAMQRMAPSMSSCCTDSSEERMRRESSLTTVIFTSVGSDSCSSATSARTRSATSTVLEPLILRISTESARPSLRKLALRASAVPSTTLATSPRRTGTPPRTATVMSRKARGSSTRPVMRTSRSWSPRRTRPAGTSWFSRCSACITCCGEMA